MINSNIKIIMLLLSFVVMMVLIGYGIYMPDNKPVTNPIIEKPTTPATIYLNMSDGTQTVCDIDKTNNIECKNISNIIKPIPVNTTKDPSPKDMGEVGDTVNTNDNKLSNQLSSGIEKPVVKKADWGTNGTIGPYGISPDGTPLFDSSVYSPAQVAELQGGYGKGYGVVETPNNKVVINVKDPNDPCSIHKGLCGVEGAMGCSGNPNPPTEADIWKFNHGIFTSRQGDIMLKDCYSPNNLHNNMTLLVTDVNGTEHALKVINNTVVDITNSDNIVNGTNGSKGF